METRKSKRSLRLALVMGAAVAGTALVGWGGLAAWQAYTQNAATPSRWAPSPTPTRPAGPARLQLDDLLAGAPVPARSSSTADQPGLDSDFPGTSGTVTITNTGSPGQHLHDVDARRAGPRAAPLCDTSP